MASTDRLGGETSRVVDDAKRIYHPRTQFTDECLGLSLTTEGDSSGLEQLRCQAVRTVTNGRTIRQPRTGNLTTGMLQLS